MLFNLSEGEGGGERGVLKYFAIVIAATIVGRTISGHGLSVISLFPLFLTLFFLFFFTKSAAPSRAIVGQYRRMDYHRLTCNGTEEASVFRVMVDRSAEQPRRQQRRRKANRSDKRSTTNERGALCVR